MSLHIGVAGWSYDDWAGMVYPRKRPRGFDALRYLAGFVDLVEINTSFYRPVPEPMAAAWVRRVADLPRFRFTAKLHKSFTHGSPGPAERAACARQMHEGLAPIAAAGKLGALLVQFPYSFRHTPEGVALVDEIRDEFSAYPLVLEVRHASWLSPEVLAWLSTRGIGFCNIDQPRLGAAIGATSLASGAVGYVRLHGRNAREWFRKDAGRDARYDYLYSAAELAPWRAKIAKVDAASPETFVIANNHFEGKAVVNALELRAALEERAVDVPPDLIARYPRLGAIATAAAPIQPSLFS